MASKESLIQREFAELILITDDAREPGDPFKLTDEMRQQVEDRLAAMVLADAAINTTEGQRLTASRTVDATIEELNRLLHDGYNHIKAIPSVSITNAERIGLFTSLGWAQGGIGEMTPARIESLANQAVTVMPTIANVAWRYPDVVMDAIVAALATLNTNQALAQTADRQQATTDRDAKLDALRRINSRVRFAYCSVSDDLDATLELVKIGRQPNRRGGPTGGGGQAPVVELPATPGTATFDSAALTLTIPELPEHATSIHAYRQRTDGGDPELAGTSTTTTVSLLGAGPLEEGVEYNAWVVGHNASGDGPASNVITLIGPA